MLDIRDFGAVGDGRTDDTAAIQKAIDRAAEINGTVFVPEGVFLCSTLRLKPLVGILGYPSWSYRQFGGSTLRLGDPDARCLVDMTGAFGAVLNGLCLDGAGIAPEAHGVMVDKPDYGSQEDTPCIDNCRIGGFGGSGIYLSRIWCFRIRHCMVCFNGGDGVRVRGWDGFILDNWLSGNRCAGYGSYEENSSVTMTGNRIEWNAQGGILVYGGSHYNITGNYIDRSGGPGISLLPSPEGNRCSTFAITGNVIYRSGAPNWRSLEENENSHVRLEEVSNTVFSGNTLRIGRDDGGRGAWSPEKAIVYHTLRHTVIKDNVMENGALHELLSDLGGHDEGVIIKDNTGSLFAPPDE